MRKFLIPLLVLSTWGYAQVVEPPAEEPVVDSALQARVLRENIRAQTQGNNAFGFELYSRLRSAKGNLFFSPYNITATMVMAYAGSHGTTQAELQGAMHYLSNNENLYAVFEWLNKHFSTAWFQGPNESRVLLGNSVWLQRDLKILPSYLDILNTYFKSSLKQVDFMRNPEAARLNMNLWVKEKTQGRITELVQAGDVDSMTRLVLISSIFMKAVWQNAFEPSLTVPEPFFLNNVDTISTPMMTRTAQFPFYETPSYQVLELPYRSSFKNEPQFSMLIVLPRNQDFSSFESILSQEAFDRILSGLSPRQVIATIPKFTFSSGFDLKGAMQQLGMEVAFSPLADFSGITGTRDLAIGGVLHKAFVAVDEKGTEAVAATAVTIGVKSYIPPEESIVFKANHPFVFFIVDRSTDSILFMGRLLNPKT